MGTTSLTTNKYTKATIKISPHSRAMTAQPGRYSSGMVGNLEHIDAKKALGDSGHFILGRWNELSELVME
jgi:hypothetical protein